jgi:hypothetical protein
MAHTEIMFIAPAEGTEYGRPYVRMGDVLIFVYRDEGKVCVTVDTEDCGDDQPEIRLNVNNGTMWEGVPGS